MAANPSIPGSLRRLEVTVASGDALDVRHFSVTERMSSLFEVSIVAMSDNPDIDMEGVVGQPMSFRITQGVRTLETRVWTGVCSQLQQTAVEERGLSTYSLTLVPSLWLATQRRNHRMFQHKSEIEIALQILGEWGVTPVQKLSGEYKKRKYRVQYGESDLAFVCRVLEDAGVSFYFEAPDGETQMVLHSAPQHNDARAPIAFRENPTDAEKEHVTAVRVDRRVRPGKYTMQDHDYRRSPSYRLVATASDAEGVEERLERYHYTPGAFLFESGKGESTPAADDKGKYRTDDGEAAAVAQRRLEAKRATAKTVAFETNTLDPAPGVVLSFLDHPKSDVGPGKRLLVVGSVLRGKHDDRWTHACDAVSADVVYRPPLTTPKPRTSGVESATVVGPPGQEIHVDEFGRVRVHFHWDRESKMDEGSSCWIHVSQPWGGTGFGGVNLPRVGQEVIVDFLGGDPDRPVIVGRVYTNLQKVPFKLPENKTQSGWKSSSTTGTGGYNEIMLEDAAGKELVRMQAERDLNKLVKRDESVAIGNDRTKQVGHDDKLTVTNDRTRQVGNNEAVQVGVDEARKVGKDRSRAVGNDESVTIGNNRSKTVGGNEDAQVAGNRSQTIGVNKSSQVGGNQDERVDGNTGLTVGKNLNVQVMIAKSESVGVASTETVGVIKTLQTGQTYKVTVGKTMSVQVGESHSETVGQSKKLTVGEVYEIQCGASAIHVDSGGNVTISAADIAIKSTGPVLVEAGGPVKVQAGGPIKVQGATVDIN